MKISKIIAIIILTLFAFIGISQRNIPNSKNSFSVGIICLIIAIFLIISTCLELFSIHTPTKFKKPKTDNTIISQNLNNTSHASSNAQSINYVETSGTIIRADGKSITDEEIPHLMQIGYEHALQAEKDSPNPKFHRTVRENDLAFNFEMKYGLEVSNLTDKFESLYKSAYKTNDFDEKISLLNQAISAFEKAKKFCYSKGKGGTIYFQDTWEYLHNSNNQCFSYLDNIQDALEDAVYLRDEVIPNIIDVITKNDGMLQRNIYKMLPDIDRSTIQRTLKMLEANNTIIRNKTGSSYELHIST